MLFAHKNPWLPIIAAALGVVLGITLSPYKGNVTALFHMDAHIAEQATLPSAFVVLDVPGYDGMHYFRIAQNIPKLFSAEGRAELSSDRTIAYAYQRFGLSLVAFILALGSLALLPWAFLLVHLGSLLLMSWLLLRRGIRPVFVCALAFSPAAMVGLHFSLAEPLTLLLVTSFLLLYTSKQQISWLEVFLLSLLVITREINIFLALFVLLFTLFKRDHTRVYLLAIPVLVFFAWHGIIYGIFEQVPFLWSTDKHALPFTAIVDILLAPGNYNMYTLSAVGLFLVFVIPAFILLLTDLAHKKLQADVLLVGSLFFLCIMSVMPDHIWGSITSIGRVITPVYPFTMLYAAKRADGPGVLLGIAVLVLGMGAAWGLATIPHPFHLL